MGTSFAEICANCMRLGSPCNKCLRDMYMEDVQRGQENRVGWRGLIGRSYAEKDRPLSTAGEKARRKKDRKARAARIIGAEPVGNELHFDEEHWRASPVPRGADVVHANWTPPDWQEE